MQLRDLLQSISILQPTAELDGVGPVGNRPSTDLLHQPANILILFF